jgi:integrase
MIAIGSLNLTISEQALDCGNGFARTFIPEEGKQRKLPIPIDSIRVIQDDCSDINDDMRWLVALLSDTVIRLGEAVGLAITDIHLAGEIPHINLTPHPWRRFKTKGSERCIPMAGEALWAASRAIEGCVVIHSFRHSLRGGLRAVECPSDIIDEIGGWTTTGIEQQYDLGQPLDVKAR